MRQGRLSNSRGGLAALANDSIRELTLEQLPVPTAMLCYTCRGGTRDSRVLRLGGTPCQLSRVGCQCSPVLGCLGVHPHPGSSRQPRVVQVQFFCEWADARMTSVEHVGMLADASVLYAQAGLAGWGWGLGYFQRKSSSRHQDCDCPRRNCIFPAVDTHAGYKYLLGSFLLHIVPSQSLSQSRAPNALHSPSLTPVHHSPAAAIICWDLFSRPVSNVVASRHNLKNNSDHSLRPSKRPLE